MHQMGAGDEHLWNMGARNILMGRRSFGSSIFLRLSPFSLGIAVSGLCRTPGIKAGESSFSFPKKSLSQTALLRWAARAADADLVQGLPARSPWAVPALPLIVRQPGLAACARSWPQHSKPSLATGSANHKQCSSSKIVTNKPAQNHICRGVHLADAVGWLLGLTPLSTFCTPINNAA